MKLTNLDYINGLRNGDHNIMVQLYKMLYDSAQRFIDMQQGTLQDAEDFIWISIEKLQKHCLKHQDFIPKGSIRAYLYEILKKTWWTYHNKENKEQKLKHASGSLLDFIIDSSQIEEKNSTIAFEMKELANVLIRMTQKTTNACQTYFDLIIKGYEKKSIIQTLQMSDNSYRQRKHKCTKKLIEFIKKSPYLDDFMDYLPN